MSNLTKEDLQEVVREAFVDRNTVGGKKHAEDHEFISVLRKREIRREQRVEKFKLSLIGTFATAIFGGVVWVGTLVWTHIFDKTGG